MLDNNKGNSENYEYLGDGVYAFFDGFGVWLRTGHHLTSKCDNEIYMEPRAINHLLKFIESASARLTQ